MKTDKQKFIQLSRLWESYKSLKTAGQYTRATRLKKVLVKHPTLIEKGYSIASLSTYCADEYFKKDGSFRAGWAWSA